MCTCVCVCVCVCMHVCVHMYDVLYKYINSHLLLGTKFIGIEELWGSSKGLEIIGFLCEHSGVFFFKK